MDAVARPVRVGTPVAQASQSDRDHHPERFRASAIDAFQKPLPNAKCPQIEGPMAESLSIDEAVRRLGAALDLLEGAVERRLERSATVSDMEGELHRLGTDRSRLAQSLDAAEARAARLEDVTGEVSRGLVDAMESIRDVLSRHGG